ncbi:hypothetical protein Plim_2321 [Planctopirus limnophila DSM 3776]|uniref:Uncharacterized protein n=1 Tax=Planctopirus limnophila (strain ATCC 43296 / DSM 3776 / IFAM 1008 / Mu 290) TaxID=521674 RepID=D5SNN3_PLAL2|nr:hypothetical protein Plim_2321 [Planctopirus limnophila DSM 3776]
MQTSDHDQNEIPLTLILCPGVVKCEKFLKQRNLLKLICVRPAWIFRDSP